MKKKNFPVIMFLLVLLATGCEKDNNSPAVVKGTGEVIEKTVELNAFNSFRLTGAANVQISIGTEQRVVLKAQQEILDVLTSEVKDGELSIGPQQSVQIDTDSTLEIDITVPQIRQIALDGTGLFELTGENQTTLSIIVNGTGNIMAYDMPVDQCTIIITGTANCYVTVNTSLSVNVAGIGYVFYHGEPVVTSNISGIGSVVDDD